MIDLGVFEVQIMRFLIKNALWLYAELCLLLVRGAHFQNFHEKYCRKVKNGKVFVFGGGLEWDRRRAGGGLEEDCKRIGGGLEKYLHRFLYIFMAIQAT